MDVRTVQRQISALIDAGKMDRRGDNCSLFALIEWDDKTLEYPAYKLARIGDMRDMVCGVDTAKRTPFVELAVKRFGLACRYYDGMTAKKLPVKYDAMMRVLQRGQQ